MDCSHQDQRGRYDGPMWIDAGKLLAMPIVSDGHGTYTSLITAVLEGHSEDGQVQGGFDVRETPEAIVAMLEGASAPEQSSPALLRTNNPPATARRTSGADAPNLGIP